MILTSTVRASSEKQPKDLEGKHQIDTNQFVRGVEERHFL